MRKPNDLAYGVDDRPPRAVLLSCALQQVAIILVLMYPAILLARTLNAPPAQAAAILSLTFLTCAVGTIVQVVRQPAIGSGYLGSMCPSASFIVPQILAANAGGLPLVAGMGLFAGLVTLVLARALHRIRALIPPAVVGGIIFMIGIAVSLTGVRTLLRADGGGPPAPLDLAVASATLAVAVGLSVWAKGFLRTVCVLVGMAAGTLVAALLGRLRLVDGFDLGALPLIGLPALGHLDLDFDVGLVPAFLIAALVATVKTVGLVTTLQKLNDAGWVRAEPRSIAGGITADGITTSLGGLLGAAVANMSVTGVSIQAASGVTSRLVAYPTAAICLVLALTPRGAALLSQVPDPVIAAVLLQAGGLMMINGMQIATSRLLDARRSAAVSLAIVAALAVEAMPQTAEWVLPALRPIMSATALGAVIAIGLNALLSLGVRQRALLEIDPRAFDPQEIQDFVEARGAAWGARRDVIQRAAFAMMQLAEAVVEHCSPRGPIRLEASFDEFNLDIRVSYHGRPLELPDRRPADAEIRDAEDGARRLAGYMLRRNADRVAASHRAGTSTLHFHFDH